MAANKASEKTEFYVRPASIDIGNDTTKAVIGEYNGLKTPIPNILVEAAAERDILNYEKTPLEGLHVEIVSSALTNGKFVGYVGSLAAKEKHKTELVKNKKTESDQTFIMMLTALAVDAVTCGKFEADEEQVYHARYLPSTGVPIAEAKKAGAKKKFKDRIINGIHSVKFLQTPEFEGKKVIFDFVDAVINNEGQAASIDLTTNPDGSSKNPELEDMDFMIHDIGALTSDKAILTVDEGIDNTNSLGEEFGVGTTLDAIIREVATDLDYQIKSRRECADILTHSKSAERYMVYVNGKPKSIKEIADKHLKNLALREYNSIDLGWQAVPALRRCYVIGGGALLLKSYIEEINQARNAYPLYFLEDDIEIENNGKTVKYKKSVWIIAQSYYILLHMYAAAKGITLTEG